MMTSGDFVCGVMVAVLLIQNTAAIKCYHCNSANNSACHDIKTFAKYNIIPLVECESAIPKSVASKFFCRKMIQTILNPGHDSEVRVTRSCGWVKHHRDRECYKADNDGKLETVCQCFSDKCNGSTALGYSTAFLFSAATAAVSLGVWTRS